MNTKTTLTFPRYVVFVSILAAAPAGLGCGASPGQPDESAEKAASTTEQPSADESDGDAGPAGDPVPTLPSQPSTAHGAPPPRGARLR
jgi:hypothetical protein